MPAKPWACTESAAKPHRPSPVTSRSMSVGPAFLACSMSTWTVSPDRVHVPTCQFRSRKEPGSNSHEPSSLSTRCTKVTVCSHVPRKTTGLRSTLTMARSPRKDMKSTAAVGAMDRRNFPDPKVSFRRKRRIPLRMMHRRPSIPEPSNAATAAAPFPQTPNKAVDRKAPVKSNVQKPPLTLVPMKSDQTATPSITFFAAVSSLPRKPSSSASVQVTRMLKLTRRLMTASLFGNFMVLRSCGRPSSCATSL